LENVVYLAVWGLLFAAPLLTLYVRSIGEVDSTFDWVEVYIVWRKFAIYLLLFLLHNFLLAPLLVHKHRRVAYFSIVAAVLLAFAVYQCNSSPERPRPMGPPPHEREWLDDSERPDFEGRPEHPGHRPHQFDAGRKPPVVGERDILAIVVLVLMFGANLGIKGYFRSREDRKRLAELEKQNLEQQLEYLRYQINPHFFMNTLNNIHALVDIDPAKAQETIVELSKMMRFVLYEGDKHHVALAKEMEFVRTYVKLMKLRYTDKVRITLDLPAEVPDRSIPPLMLISFVENAFKHGVSYQHESFIEIKVALEDDSLHFFCRNSKAEVPNQEKGGVGLANVRKRLNLLYDHNYTLRIHDDADVYSVELVIPVKS
jgi:two-component sensor histidine kinase